MAPVRARILLVDDEPNILMTVKEILVQQGYDVDAEPDGLSAVKALQHSTYDLVLTDLKMEGMDGLALLEEVRNHSPQTVTVMMTGYGSVDSATEAVRLGAYEYLLKPVAVEELKQAVERSLERKRFSEIDTLYRVSNELAVATSEEKIQAVVIDAATKVLGASRVHWFPVKSAGSVEAPEPYVSLFPPSVILRLASSEVVLENRPTVDGGATKVALVPGVANDHLTGVLYVDHGPEPFEFHATWQRFLCGLARQAAIALDRLAVMEELKQSNAVLASANRRLQELDTLKSEFLSVATHELRTPLSIILGYNAMIEESALERLTAEERGLLRESLSACKRLMRLVNSMLDLSQLQSGKIQLQMSVCDLGQSLRSVVKLFEAEAHRRRLNIELKLDPAIPQVEVDPERIEQVFVNLVSNALKYTDADGLISITGGAAENGTVAIHVSDTGIGIAPEHQEMIFDEFARVRSTSTVRPGSGLGLAIVRRILGAHGGDISVNSIPGQGSTFTVRLPLRQRIHNVMVA
jgi:signal transduction histidine kinase/CheY-like chemotaxis protein